MASNVETPRDLATSTAETRPLFRSSQSQNSLALSSIGTMWLVVVVASLTGLWCIFDSWNHEMNSQLFAMSVGSKPSFGDSLSPAIVEPTGKYYSYALTLTWMQFAFMAILFLSLYAIQMMIMEEKQMRIASLYDRRWAVLVPAHILSSVLLQALMMPTQMMSLAVFAATRAVEVPWAATVRAHAFNVRFGGHPVPTTVLMFSATCMLFYAYTEIAECLCVWSGFGVQLTGPALYFMYALLLTVPATKTVYQESALVHFQAEPLFILGFMNLGACFLFAPVLAASHYLGYENVVQALEVIRGDPQILLMVLWLSVFVAALSAFETALICTVDSFWTVAMRSLRVVYWWSRELVAFYFLSGGKLLSVARPHASFWSFMMLAGVVLAVFAIFSDRTITSRKSSKGEQPLSDVNSDSRVPGLRYV